MEATERAAEYCRCGCFRCGYCHCGSRAPSLMRPAAAGKAGGLAELGLAAAMGGAPGFRFHPTDEELVSFYLLRRAAGLSGPSFFIPDLDLYKHDPWELPGLWPLPYAGSSAYSQWLFFNVPDRKYPRGSRANRATSAGYWKATGRDRSVSAAHHAQTGADRGQPAADLEPAAHLGQPPDADHGQPAADLGQPPDSGHGATPLHRHPCGSKKTLVFYLGRAPHGKRTPWVMHEFHLLPHQLPPTRCADEIVLCRIVKKAARKCASPEEDDTGDEGKCS